MQALQVAGMVRPGRRGLGFGVGVEPITPYLAAQGCSILATDLPSSADASVAWNDTGQHAARLADLNREGLCPADDFAARVEFRAVDMNAIPDDFADFDFAWSSCAMEHLGSLQAGIDFLERQLRCVKPGGITVHTTEFNVSSNDDDTRRRPHRAVPTARPRRPRDAHARGRSRDAHHVRVRVRARRPPRRQRAVHESPPPRVHRRLRAHVVRSHHSARAPRRVTQPPRRDPVALPSVDGS